MEVACLPSDPQRAGEVGESGGGLSFEWAGYALDLTRFGIGLSEPRMQWCRDWITRLLADRRVLIQEASEGLGRLSFAAGPLFRIRPHLGPFFAWVSACPRHLTLRLPLLLVVTLQFLLAALETPLLVPCVKYRPPRRDTFRYDARAGGDIVVVGGWRGDQGTTMEADWFSIRLTKALAPWIWAKGEPFKLICSLELLGALLSLVVLVPCSERFSEPRAVPILGFTDNQANQHLANKSLTTKLPLAAVLMELSLQAEKRGILVELSWIPRLQNVEADALTNEDFAQFDASRRKEVDWPALDFSILPQLLDTMAAFNEELEAGKCAKKTEALAVTLPVKQAQPRKKRRVPLREREPWR